MYFHSEFIFTPTERFPSCHAANLAVLADNELVVVYFAGAKEGSLDSAHLMQRLRPDGTWSVPQVIQIEPDHPAGNAVLMPLPDGRTLFFYTLAYPKTGGWADALVHFRISADNGTTWGPKRNATEEYGFICRQPGLILAPGEWLLPIYDNRGGANQIYSGMGGNEGSVLITDDEGRHWQHYGRMVAGAGLAQPCVIDMHNGHLRAWLRTRNYWNGSNPDWAFLYRCDSFDNGRNWTAPEPTDLPNNNSSFQVKRLQDGALVLAYNHQSGRTRSPLNIRLSHDNGITWSRPKELEPFDPAGGEYSYPAIAETPDRRIHIVYTYLRTHIKHIICDQEWVLAV
ncbi:MAG: sialidase family protein [Anaerolineae bacterium]